MGPRDAGDRDLPGRKMSASLDCSDPYRSPARGRRLPSGGWILPSFDDRVVNDARDGFSLEEICERQRSNAEIVLAVVHIARSRGFLTDYEAFGIAG